MEPTSAAVEAPYLALLNRLPLPCALLDEEGRYLFLNAACAEDRLLARGAVGRIYLADEREETARRRAAAYRTALETGGMQLLAERAAAQDVLWVWVPLAGLNGAPPRMVVTFALADAMPAADQRRLLGDVEREVRVPLVALIGLAGTLGSRLQGASRETASLLERSGRRVLGCLDELVKR